MSASDVPEQPANQSAERAANQSANRSVNRSQGRPAIEVDPVTGARRFFTRAASLEGRSRQGYSVVDDALKVLPDQPREAVFDADEKARYRSFKEARRGAADYVPLEGDYARYLEEPSAQKPVPREALADECEVLVIGAGFSGLILWHKLSKAGFSDVRFCEKGGDVGGTWYWNRYPGVACDVEAYSYLPLLEEMGYVPPMKYASGLEIYEYCQAMAERFGFFEHCLFHTTVEKTEWDEAAGRWTVHTDRGDAMRARFVVLANGILTSPHLARIEGMHTFEGAAFHTSRWRHDVDLAGKTVGVIGTGATAVQVVPALAGIVKDLYVFQRTPSTVDVRGQRETTDEERSLWAGQPGWARARRARYAMLTETRSAHHAGEDFLAGRQPELEAQLAEAMAQPVARPIEEQLDANFRVMEQIRARIDATVRDPKVAAALKPYYPYGCKRATFHDEFLAAFNRDNVHLVDTSPGGVRQINPRGVVHDGVEYPLDAIVFATGFQFMATSTFNMVIGRGGQTLSDKWNDTGTSTFLGLHSRGFPNLFIVTGPQGGPKNINFTVTIDAHAEYIAWMLATMRDTGRNVVDVTREAEDAWTEHCAKADIATAPLRDCISYFNHDGTAKPGSLVYFGGKWHQWRDNAQKTLKPFIFNTNKKTNT